MIENNDNINEQFTSIAPIVIVAVLVLCFLFRIWWKQLYPEEKYKSEVAKDYGVSKYHLSKWIKSLCPIEVVQKHGGKTQKILLKDIEPHLGKHTEIPTYSIKGGIEGRIEKQIIKKEDLWKAYEDMSDSTLYRIIKAIENPIETIGMSRKTYSSLKSFPPSKMNLICDYLESLGYERKKKALCKISRQNLNLLVETVDYVEFADIN